MTEQTAHAAESSGFKWSEDAPWCLMLSTTAPSLPPLYDKLGRSDCVGQKYINFL